MSLGWNPLLDMALLLDSHYKHSQLASCFDSEVDPFFIKKIFHADVNNFLTTYHELMRMEVEVFDRGMVFEVD